MKLIIDISEDMYKDANILIVKDLPELKEIIANGIPLPKGHGDLIDRDKLSYIYRQMSYCSTAPNFIWVSELMKVTPVVESDKSEVD